MAGPGRSRTGLPATFSDSPYGLTAEVVEHAELVFLPRQRLLNLLRDQPHRCFQGMNIVPEGLTPTRTALEGLRKVVC